MRNKCEKKNASNHKTLEANNVENFAVSALTLLLSIINT